LGGGDSAIKPEWSSLKLSNGELRRIYGEATSIKAGIPPHFHFDTQAGGKRGTTSKKGKKGECVIWPTGQIPTGDGFRIRSKKTREEKKKGASCSRWDEKGKGNKNEGRKEESGDD